ncbi:MAG TPA: DUF4097 family beta strand repeat-containing protein [Lapillicoccus sp.]|nr:DUF4097 family beta strand repeat-containing protein [Lapillicoccus sp.]
MSSTGPQDSPVWPPVPQDRVEPPPPAAPAPAPARPSRRPRRVAIFAAGALVVAGAGTALAVNGVPRAEQRSLLTHAITALDVETQSGDVTVRAGARTDTVEVIRRFRGDEDTQVGGETWQGNTLKITPDCTTVCDVDYEIRVPSTVAVTVRTGSGDVELSGRLGEVSLGTVSGDVDANVSTTTLSSETGSGDMDFHLGSAPDRLTAQSVSGDIDLRVPAGDTYAVTSNTTSGDVDVDVPRQSDATHLIDVRTASGDISVDAR